MTDEELQAIRERCEAATPGPWKVYNLPTQYPFAGIDADDRAVAYKITSSVDADFIAHARTDIPALLAEVERLRAHNAKLRDRLGKSAQEAFDHYAGRYIAGEAA